MLLTGKKWNDGYKIEDNSPTELVDILLDMRNIDSDEGKEEFLSDNPLVWYDPFLFKDMHEAVDITVDAIASGKKILVYGDYDADGVTATSILVRYFRSIGSDVDYIVPHRSEHGYGLTDRIIDSIMQRKPDLIITVDCGISNFDTVEQIKNAGIKIIITDHHTVQDNIPNADAVICAKRLDNEYPCQDLCGAGVALKFVEAMGRDGRYKVTPNIWKQGIELAGVATIADLVPVVGENRTLIKKAFQSMKHPSNLGVKVMNEMLLAPGKTPDEGYISFTFVPRVNADGRLYDASNALALFLEDDLQRVRDTVRKLGSENDERKAVEARVFEQAKAQVENKDRPSEWLLMNTKGPVVVCGKDWHPGVLGIVAGKLAMHFRRSAVVFTTDASNPEQIKGSARSYGDYDIFKAISSNAELCVNFGGHKKAAGLTVEKKNIGKFMKAIEEYSCEMLDGETEETGEILNTEVDLPAHLISMDTYEQLIKMAPFGIGNPKPILRTENLVISSMQLMGETGTHLRLELFDGSSSDAASAKTIGAVGFGMSSFMKFLKVGDRVDIAYTMDVFGFRGVDSISLHLCDIKPIFPKEFLWQKPEIAEQLFVNGLELSQIAKLAKVSDKENLIPADRQYEACYKAIKMNAGEDISIADCDLLAWLIRNSGTPINPFQIRRCLEVFDEAGLIKLGVINPTRVCFCLLSVKQKVKLSETESFKRLKTYE